MTRLSHTLSMSLRVHCQRCIWDSGNLRVTILTFLFEGTVHNYPPPPSGQKKRNSEQCQLFNRVRLFATPGTAAHQAPPSMGFSRQEDWSGLPFSSPGDIPNPGIEPWSPALQVDSSAYERQGSPQNEEEEGTKMAEYVVSPLLLLNGLTVPAAYLKAGH